MNLIIGVYFIFLPKNYLPYYLIYLKINLYSVIKLLRKNTKSPLRNLLDLRGARLRTSVGGTELVGCPKIRRRRHVLKSAGGGVDHRCSLARMYALGRRSHGGGSRPRHFWRWCPHRWCVRGWGSSVRGSRSVSPRVDALSTPGTTKRKKRIRTHKKVIL